PTFDAKSVDTSLSIFPNPVKNDIYIDFHSIGKVLRISIIGTDGKHIHTIFNKVFPKGKRRVVFNVSNLPAGHYFCSFQSGTIRQSKAFTKM
ncbi:MAG TPA: T9SS type A sorting domain-containing protein, partial [Saprospiraceae bacterium]|nr:T9SS type A sorting domain-containing protein [Saprospiraceae bacterium]